MHNKITVKSNFIYSITISFITKRYRVRFTHCAVNCDGALIFKVIFADVLLNLLINDIIY